MVVGGLYTLNNLVTLFSRSLGCVQDELLCFDWCFREYCVSFVDLTFLIMFANILILFSLCFYVFEIFVVMTRFKNLQFVCLFPTWTSEGYKPESVIAHANVLVYDPNFYALYFVVVPIETKDTFGS